MWIASLLVSLCLLRPVSTNFTHIGNLASVERGSSKGLFDKFALLEPRQQGECPDPGGVDCPGTNTCCPSGAHCCAGSDIAHECCTNDSRCFGTNHCCPNEAQTCGGKTCCEAGTVCCSNSPTGCCISGGKCCKSSTNPCCPAGYICCGETCCPEGGSCCGNGCCGSGEICERNECISSVYSNRIARFEYDEKKNGALLRNMCNGLRGQNTKELTYSGKLSASQQRTKRGQAGCVSGYCRSLGQPGLNSCDEFPFASTDEGGGATPEIERALACIPGVQNSYQGGVLGSFVRNRGLVAGDRYVVSIDCDKVLGSIKRDTIPQISGVPTRDDIYPPLFSDNAGSSYIIAGFGDLGPGTYNATATVVSGTVTGGFLSDNQGNNLSTSDVSIRTGQSQQFSFSIEEDGELMGVGILLAIGDNKTNITWTFQGQDLPPSQTTSRASPSGGGTGPLGGGVNSASPRMILPIGLAMVPLVIVSLLLRA